MTFVLVRTSEGRWRIRKSSDVCGRQWCRLRAMWRRMVLRALERLSHTHAQTLRLFTGPDDVDVDDVAKVEVRRLLLIQFWMVGFHHLGSNSRIVSLHADFL